MFYVDRNFRFYNDEMDSKKWPELKPTPDAVALTDEQVKEITADITLWRWNPVENKPYRLPDVEEKYRKVVDGVVLEMSAAEKAAVDQAEADALAAKQAEAQAIAAAAALAKAEQEAKSAKIAKAKTDVVALEAAVDKATDTESLKKIVLDLIKALRTLTE